MRRISFIVFATLLSVIGCADETRKDSEGLQGTWEVVEFIADGRSLPQEARQEIKIAFKGDKMQISGPGGIGVREYVFKLDPSTMPKAIDVTSLDGPLKDETGTGIYELKENALKLCVPNQETTARPTEFKAPQDSDLGLFVLRRSR